MAKSDKPGVFISYSQHDEPMMRQLVAHLSMLEADLWPDRMLVGGERWAETLDDRLNTAEIVLLLVSHNFLSSNFCMKVELTRALERERKGETKIIPVIISDCDWENAPFNQFQILPTNRKAIESWEKQNEAFKDVVKGIRQKIAEIQPRPESPVQAVWQPPNQDRPYLCDRSDQEDVLKDALVQHQQSKNTRPIVCFVHGEEREAHDKFLERVNGNLLPILLGTGVKGELHDIEVPRRDFNRKYWQRIGDVFGAIARQEIWNRMIRHDKPLLFRLSLDTGEFGDYCEELIESLMEFCGEWEDLPAGRTVIHCVCLKYTSKESTGWLDFKKKKRLQVDDRLRNKLAAIESSEHAKLTNIVLPELEAIRRHWAEVWSKRHFPTLTDDVAALFEQKHLCNRDGHIPMKTFAKAVAEKLNKERGQKP